VKIVSGTFERNQNYLHVRQNRQMKFSSPTAFMASKKSVIEEAFPGDIIGLHDTGNFKIGDTLTAGEMLNFKGIPTFSPELFKYVVNKHSFLQTSLTGVKLSGPWGSFSLK